MTGKRRPRCSTDRWSSYYDSLERIERYRRQAKDLHAQAERLRRKAS